MPLAEVTSKTTQVGKRETILEWSKCLYHVATELNITFDSELLESWHTLEATTEESDQVGLAVAIRHFERQLFQIRISSQKCADRTGISAAPYKE